VYHLPQAAQLFEVPQGAAYVGRHKDPALDGTVVLGYRLIGDQPLEDPEDGCPAAWHRTPFVRSLAKYTRKRTGDGNRVANRAYDTAPWQVCEAVEYFELEQEACLRHTENTAEERRRADREKQASAAKLASGRPLTPRGGR
jgi:hypothetical protein